MQKVLKYSLILAIGFTLGYQSSKNKIAMSKIEIGVLAKSEAHQNFEKVYAEVNKVSKNLASETRSKDSVALGNSEINYSLHELSDLLQKRQDAIQKNYIKPLLEDENLSKEEMKEEYFGKISKAFEVSNHWKGQSTLEIAGESVPMMIYLQYYNTTANEKEAVPMDMDNICWGLGIVINPDDPEKMIKANAGDCLSPTKKDGFYYLSFNAFYFTAINKIFDLILFPIPQDSQNHMEYLSAGNTHWQKGAEVSWEPLSSEEGHEISNKYFIYRVD